MIRKIIHIDEEKCDGCGACVNACHEGAIGLVNGKAKLMHEHYCDGLGDCLPACHTNAITFEEREAPAYDEAAVLAAKADQFGQFVEKCRSLDNPPELLCWLPNPIFPQKDGRNGQWRLNDDPDVEAVRYYDGMLRAMRSWCQAREVALVDGKALFEIVGQKTAMSWMADCFRPNADGCRNLHRQMRHQTRQLDSWER